MRNIIRKFITALAFATFAAATAWASDRIPGIEYDGSAHLIKSADDWCTVANFVSTNGGADGLSFRLVNNISFEDKTFIPIGQSGAWFNGKFDGGGFTISDIVYSTESDNVGLFGCVWGPITEIHHVRLANSSFSGGNNVGGIVGYLDGPTDASIHDCFVANSNFSGGNNVGGIVGYIDNDGGSIQDCFVFDTTFSGSQNSCGVIFGSSNIFSFNSRFNCVKNFYHGCTVTIGSAVYTSGIGCGADFNGDIGPEDSFEHAMAMYTLSLPSGVTVTNTESCVFTSGSDKYYGAGYTITLDELSAGYIYRVNGQAISGNSFIINADAVVTHEIDPDQFSQSGNQYFIHTAGGWNVFCDLLENNDYGYFSDKTVFLTNPITVNRMAGSEGHEFTGTFKGQEFWITFNYTATENYAAPFRNVKGANVEGAKIEDVRVTGTITTSAQFAAGIIACQEGTVTITNCRSNVTISSSKSGDGTHGGLVAEAKGTHWLTISGCIFDGRLLGSDTNSCGGFVGWSNYSTRIYASLFVPAEITVGTSESATFARGNSPTVIRSYYTTAFGSAQGTQALVTATEPAGLGAQVTKYSNTGITSYDNGLYWGGDYYYGTPEAWSDSYTEYTINNAGDWGTFCDLLANKAQGYFNGKTVKLGADITVTRMAGSSGHAFTGIFDGDGHTLTFNYTATEEYAAPFRYVNSESKGSQGVIKNLHTAGTITTSAKYAAGIVACLSGPVTITNCRSNVTISSSLNGDGTHGGLVAKSDGHPYISGCVFDGKLLGTSTTHCGGFVGWNNNEASITDCLFAPTEVTVGNTESATFARGNTPVFTHSYYTTDLGSTQATLALVSTIQPSGVGNATGTAYNVSGITCHTNGLYWNGKYYYVAYEAFDKSSTEYTINYVQDWNSFCYLLANNDKYYFDGKTVKLGANITVDRMAGEENHDFTGTFDGQGHTLTFNYTATENYAAPFRYVNKHGVIKNLHTTGTITTSAKYAAGIIAYQGSTVPITNCRSSITIRSSINGDGTHGGLVATVSDSETDSAVLTIEGCVFDGKIVSTGAAPTTDCGGFVGWKGDHGTLNIVDCLYAPQADGNAVSVGATFARNWSGTPTNSYYTQVLGDAQGTAAIITTDKPDNIGAMGSVYSVSGITPYAKGLYRDGNYYSANPTFNQNLTLVEGKVANIVKSSGPAVPAYKYVGTFYNATSNYQLPAGAMAYTAKNNEGNWEFYRIGTESNIIPAGTAVVIVSDAASIELVELESDPGITAGPNDLQGSDGAVNNSNFDKYVLGRFGGDKNYLGFYKYCESSIPAGKAYYVPQN